MSRSYYYTTASLPTLNLEQPLPFDWDGFIMALDTEVTPDDCRKLALVSIDPLDTSQQGVSAVQMEYLRWETSLRNDLVRIRAAMTGRDPHPWLQSGESYPDTQAIAQNAGRIDSPLEAEDFLDRSRWKKIDELVNGEYFNIRWLTGYALKLKILIRRSHFERERGEKRYGELYQAILDQTESEFTSGELNG